MDIQPQPWPDVQRHLPALSAAERDDLKRSIDEYGVKYPVLVMPDGRIIDGHHRWECSGGTADYRIEDVDEETGFAIALALNLARRHLTPEQTLDVRALLKANREAAKRVVAVMTKQGKSQKKIGEAIGLSQQRVSELIQAASSTSTSTASGTGPTLALNDGNTRRRKIPLADEAAIRDRLQSGESQRSLAATYGVTDRAIGQFLERATARAARSEYDPIGHRRFTDAVEEQIEARYRGGESNVMLAAAYQCNDGTITNIINRVRSRWEGDVPPQRTEPVHPGNTVVGNNVIDFPTRAGGRRPTAPPPPKPTVAPEVIQREAVRWLKEARLLKDKLNGLHSRFGDALVEALATSAEGEVMGRDLEVMAEAFRAFASSIRRGKAGREDQRHGSTGA